MIGDNLSASFIKVLLSLLNNHVSKILNAFYCLVIIPVSQLKFPFLLNFLIFLIKVAFAKFILKLHFKLKFMYNN